MTSFRTKPGAEYTFLQHHLLRKWRTASYQRGWRFRADWFLPEVRTVVTSLASSTVVPAPAAKSLGAARARNGVSIRETLNDFRALFTAAERALDIDALLSIAEGWAEGAETAPTISCTDVYTGLATPAHFQRRIHEVSALGAQWPGSHAVAIISLPRPRDSRSHCWTLLARLGDVVNGELKGTGATAMYQNSAVHILFYISDTNLSQLVECKAALEALGDGRLCPAHMNFFPLSEAAATAATPKTAARDSSS
ncbi:hypothetical protein [Arthrobacter sp. EpRS71]|uniref:hypothetical protein n=1 Tax=Arthrobacter sp. EpRS71 TaxID=1743141 RepID=UPI000746FAEB|nr:hypothetical protein [Arthrobacter sp. EpRS71]KUM34491.1 hypothetical protein AR689_10100 [Arthrobacter sp. EpRS71]